MEYTLDCGCSLWVDSKTLMPDLTYCPKHKAAPELYEACKSLFYAFGSVLPSNSQAVLIARQAIAKAEGK